MGFYLVTKNNLKRQLKNKMTYALIIVIPIILVGVISIIQYFEKREFRVGIVKADELQLENVEQILAAENVSWEIVKDNENARYIMGDYHYLIDFSDEVEAKVILEEIQNNAMKYLEVVVDSEASTKKKLSMIFSVYLIIATVYATRMISDKNEGVIERFNMSGLSKNQYIAGYLISVFVVVFMQISIIMTLLRNMLGISHIVAILVCVSMTIITTIYGVFHACVYKTEMKANMMASSVAAVLSVIYMSLI